MAQEDKGLVLRGLLLLGAIGILVVVVLSFLFWRATEPLPAPDLGNLSASEPGWKVRYNAATTLARRGSTSVPWALLREMLDEKQQMRNCLEHGRDGKDIYDEAVAQATVISAMKAIAAWHEKHKADPTHDVSTELREVYVAVDKLAESPIVELKVEAEKARLTFFR